MNKEKLASFFKRNKWLILASVFFVLWKFFLIGLLWDNRTSPPEPDDSWTYISQIDSVTSCQKIFCSTPNLAMSNYTGFIYLSYRLFFGVISKLFHISALNMYHFSFYIGSVFILFALIYFLSRLTKNKNLVAFSIIFLAFYYGTGETHGFFWVVPSFFSMMMFVLMFSVFIDKESKKWPIILLILTPIFIFSHPISIYLLAIPIIFLSINYLLIKKVDVIVVKKIILVLIISFFCYSYQSYYLGQSSQKNYLGIGSSLDKISVLLKNSSVSQRKNTPEINQANQSNNPLSPQSAITENKNSDSFIPKKISVLSIAYFAWFFPHWIGFVPLIIFLSVLFKYKQTEVISLYIASFLFFVISTFLNDYGYRAAIILWLSTFVLYSFGVWFTFIFIKENIKNRLFRNLAIFCVSIGFIVFISINVSYSLLYAINMNLRYNYIIPSSFITYLISNTSKGDPISMPRLLRFYSSETPLLYHNPLSTAAKSKYVVQLAYQDEEDKIENSKINHIFNSMLNIFHIKRPAVSEHVAEKIPPNFILEKNFDSIIIYKNSLWNH